MLICLVGLWFALRRLHVLEVRRHSLSQSETVPMSVLLNRLDPRPVRLEFDCFPTRAIQNLGAILHLFTFSAALPPLDVVVSFEMNLDFSVHANLVAEFTVRLHDG